MRSCIIHQDIHKNHKISFWENGSKAKSNDSTGMLKLDVVYDGHPPIVIPSEPGIYEINTNGLVTKTS